MRQLLNLAYHTLSQGMTKVERAQLDVALSDPAERERALARQNEEAMRQLGGFGMKPPPRRPPQ